MKIFTNGLSDEQVDMYSACLHHLFNQDEEQILIVGAYAGTGKTFVARKFLTLCTQLGKNVACCSITGRAVAQLTKSGVPNGYTCHSLLYTPIFNKKTGDIERWERKDPEDIKQICGDGIVVDEASMLQRKIFNDLIEIGVPIILLGDYAQLPAIEDRNSEPFNAMTDVDAPSITLSEIRRFDVNSGIGWLTEHLRKSDSIPRRKKEDLSVLPKNMVINKKWIENNDDVDIFICGMNKTRRRINDLVRNSKGYSGELPCIGERVVCLKNTGVSFTVINNGELFEVTGVLPGLEISRIMLKPLDRDNSKIITVEVDNRCWTEEIQKSDLETSSGGTPVPMTYGYCLTCHKTQGSTFDNVVFIDEDVSFFLDRKKFRYTACSRAAKKLVVAV